MKSKLDKLEKMRGFAAIYVFLGHLLLRLGTQKASRIGFLLRFGQEAVMLFFLISGFVIYLSVAQRPNPSFLDYFQRRFRRIYPIFLLALVISIVCSILSNGAVSHPGIGRVLGNLFMLQDFRTGKPGVWVSPLGGNSPLWSLSYEWWFYMLFFPVYRFVPAPRRLHLVAGLSLLGFVTYLLLPNQISIFLMYFILWWAGAELARNYLSEKPITLVSQRWTIFYIAFFTVCMAGQAAYYAKHYHGLTFGLHPVLELRHFSACLLFCISGILWSRLRWVGFDPIFRIFLTVSPISYALYVFHYPLAVSSSYLDWIPSPALRVIGYVLITFTAAYLAEVRLQPLITRWFDQKFKSLGSRSARAS